MAIPGSNSLGDKKFEAKVSDKVHKAYMTKEERTYLRNKSIMEKVWPVFRFLILFGLCFVILYPLIFMVSCAFRLQYERPYCNVDT